MHVLISGATGFVGKGVLAEALSECDLGRDQSERDTVQLFRHSSERFCRFGAVCQWFGALS